jgi:predicted PurR-regulated permease PerM
MFGIPGGIIAIPVAGCVKILVEEYVKKVQRERQLEERREKEHVVKLQSEN